ncbi:MAG TPA: hypothetical protein VE953_05700, partial [Terriglobales bacterium]|nr:hypothetical protein [Terriglobales bacterium]
EGAVLEAWKIAPQVVGERVMIVGYSEATRLATARPWPMSGSHHEMRRSGAIVRNAPSMAFAAAR